jgi:hypothetical protein
MRSFRAVCRRHRSPQQPEKQVGSCQQAMPQSRLGIAGQHGLAGANRILLHLGLKVCGNNAAQLLGMLPGGSRTLSCGVGHVSTASGGPKGF